MRSALFLQMQIEPLFPQTKPGIICSRKDINDEYLPFSVFTDFILNEKNTCDPADCPVIFSALMCFWLITFSAVLLLSEMSLFLPTV